MVGDGRVRILAYNKLLVRVVKQQNSVFTREEWN